MAKEIIKDFCLSRNKQTIDVFMLDKVKKKIFIHFLINFLK